MVDWIGNDLFGTRHFKNNCDPITERLMVFAENHKKPIMIGESTAAKVGTLKGEESWREWFKPYFEWIEKHPNVKAFCYVNWNWAVDWKQPEWGDCRIEDNEMVKSNYIQELSKDKYLHYSDIAA